MGAGSSRDDTDDRSTGSGYSSSFRQSQPYYPDYEHPRQYPPPYPSYYSTSSQRSTSSPPHSETYSSLPPPAPERYQPQPERHSSPPPPAADARRRRFNRTYSRIADNYRSLDQVTDALAQAGLESSNLIVGIDFTKSNEWTGKISFNRRSLHHIGDSRNPYEQAISIIGRTLSSFDEDNLIPCYGFGDASTHDQHVFSFYPDGRPCEGFEEALSRYREIVPSLRLSGPTSFAPIIEMATTIVEQSGGQYHVLLIIADGQVTSSMKGGYGQLSSQEQKTVEAIVRASQYPLSVVLVGVGDGPWDMMKEFDDNIPERSFDNFQFVNFTEIMSKNTSANKKEAEFALAALMEIPSQYKATLELGILGRSTGRSPGRVALPPPVAIRRVSTVSPKSYQSSTFKKTVASTSGYDTAPATTNSASDASVEPDNQVCSICYANRKNMAFGCGHQTCHVCAQTLEDCPICRKSIEMKIRLY